MPATTVKTRGAINVTAYGAKGDGTTDDTNPIRAAAAAAASKGVPLYFPAPPAWYRTTNIVTVTNGVPLIYGDGPASLIRCEHADGITLEIDNCLDITVRDLALSCNLTERVATSQGLRVDACQRVLVTAVHVYDTTGNVTAGINVSNGSRVTVTGCHITDTYADGIRFVAASDVAAIGNTIDGAADDCISFVNYGTGSNQPEDPTQFRCRAVGNTCTNSTGGAGIAVHGASQVIVTGNNIDGTTSNGVVVDGEGTYDVRTPARVVVSNNVIVDAGSLAQSGSYHGVYVNALANPDPATDTIISGNVIVNPRNSGVLATAERVSITGNRVDLGSSAAVAIVAGSTSTGTTPPDDLVVSGNVVQNLSAGGIVVTCPTGTAANRVAVTGNIVVEPAGASIDGINVTRGNGVVVSGNIVEDQGSNARAAVFLSGCANVELGRNSLVGNTTVTLSSCTVVRRDEYVVSSTPADTTTYRAGQVAVDTTNNRFAIFNGSSWQVVA